MDKYCNCKFCDIAHGNIVSPDIDDPLFSNEEFFAIPSIGAIVEGWILIVSRIHIPSMRLMYEKKSFKDILKDAVSALREVYGPVILFEHGSSKEGSITGCGTNHAHVHLVSINGSLVEDVIVQSYNCWMKCKISDLSTIVDGNEYLFYSDLDQSEDFKDQYGYVHILKCETSQYFRKLIAKKVNRESCYDYKKYPFLENVMNTKDKISRQIFACKDAG